MRKIVLPVIHFLDPRTALSEAQIAFDCGADGVFLISHNGDDDALFAPAGAIKGRHPDKLVGLNLLARSPEDCIRAVDDLKIDLAWIDNPGVTSRGISEAGRALADLHAEHRHIQLFGSVAFKYQPLEPDPPAAAIRAWSHGMIATTSGTATGSAPDAAKIAAMRAKLGHDVPLAIASGMSPENVHLFTPYATHFLVSTHVSRDEYHLDPERLARFVAEVARDPANAAPA